MGENKKIIESENTEIMENNAEIQSLIYVIQGKQVMPDSDLAMLYQVETKALNRAMKRSEKRFPQDFCFQLTKEEYENLRCQNGTSSFESNNYGGRRYYPFVYSESGIAMLSAILRSEIAIEVSIKIMKTFVEMRKYMANNSFILEKLSGLEQHQIETDINMKNLKQRTEEQLAQVFDYISDHKEDNQKIFFDGQIFDAFSLMVSLIQQAEKRIRLIDGYVDVITLNILAKKKDGVDVVLYTLPSAKITTLDIANFNLQYPNLTVKHVTNFHDRFLIIDESKAYHIGSSLKDVGKKCFGINRIEDYGVIHEILQRTETLNDIKN